MRRPKLTKAERERWARLHGGAEFDPRKRTDVIGDEARKLVLGAFIESLDTLNPENQEELKALARGLMVGVACSLLSMSKRSDEAHAAFRATMIQLAPWAVDMARSMEGLGPLPDA